MWGQWFTIANNPDRFPLLVTLGWGIGLAMHGINVFFKSRLMDRLNDQAFEREIALEKQRLRMVGQDDSIEEKPKRKSRPMTGRLTDDGELADVEEDYSAASQEDGQNRS